MIERDHLGEAAAAYALGALTQNEKQAADRHLADCADCRREVDEFRQVVGVLPLSAPPAIPGTLVKRRLLAAARGGAARRARSGRSAWPAAGWLVAAAAISVAGIAGSDESRLRAHLLAQMTALQTELNARRHESSDASAVMVALASGAYWKLPAVEGGAGQCAILQPPNETALLLGTFPKAPSGMLYRIWIIRRGRAHGAAAISSPGMHMMHLTMPVRRGDVVAFTLEHSGASPIPGAPFIMRVTLD